MIENAVHELTLYEKGLTAKSGRELAELRRKFYEFAFKIAPKYECPQGPICHVFLPNGNCFYMEGFNEPPFPYGNEIETYEDSAGFCPVLLYFFCLVGKNLKQGKDYYLDRHNCEDWGIEYFDSEHHPKSMKDVLFVVGSLNEEKFGGVRKDKELLLKLINKHL